MSEETTIKYPVSTIEIVRRLRDFAKIGSQESNDLVELAIERLVHYDHNIATPYNAAGCKVFLDGVQIIDSNDFKPCLANPAEGWVEGYRIYPKKEDNWQYPNSIPVVLICRFGMVEVKNPDGSLWKAAQ